MSDFLINDLYQLHIDVSIFNIQQNINAIGSKRPRDSLNDRYLWHLRLGHIVEFRINKLEKSGLLSLLTFESYPICESCLHGKMTKLSFVGHGEGSWIFFSQYIQMCAAHLMCRLEAILSTSLSLPMIYLGIDMFIL